MLRRRSWTRIGRRSAGRLIGHPAIHHKPLWIAFGKLLKRVDFATAKKASNKDVQQAAQILSKLLGRVKVDELPVDTLLDVLEGSRAVAAIKGQNTSELTRLLKAYENSVRATPDAKNRPLLHGGSAVRGKRIFFERTEVSCVRCHQIGERGGQVGPKLTQIAKEKKRDYLLQSILEPNAAIAKNFESVRVRTEDGEVFSGIVKEDTDDSLVLMNAEGQLIKLDPETIEARRKGQSAMPEGLAKRLKPSELRDLVEYLSTLK